MPDQHPSAVLSGTTALDASVGVRPDAVEYALRQVLRPVGDAGKSAGLEPDAPASDDPACQALVQ